MVLDGLRRDEQTRRDLSIRQLPGDQGQDLDLPRSELPWVVDRRPAGAPTDAPDPVLAQPLRHEACGRHRPQALEYSKRLPQRRFLVGLHPSERGFIGTTDVIPDFGGRAPLAAEFECERGRRRANFDAVLHAGSPPPGPQLAEHPRIAPVLRQCERSFGLRGDLRNITLQPTRLSACRYRWPEPLQLTRVLG